MVNKKIPMRTCIVTHEKLPKRELIRVVKNKSDEVFVDTTGKLNGRGVYLKIDKSVFDKARDSKVLNKVLEVDIPDGIYEDLYKLL